LKKAPAGTGIILLLLQNFSFVTATAKKRSFAAYWAKNCKSLCKSNRLLQQALLLLALALLMAGAALFFGMRLRSVPDRHDQALEIRDAGSGRLYASRPLRGEGEFAIEFIHSVNQSPVRETFAARNGEIEALETRFFSFGAGMQSDLEEGQQLIRDGEAMVITGLKRRFRELNLIVGTVSDHLLYINGETISLRDLCGKNAHIKIRTR
jgi:hypothetical protein